MGRVGMPSTEAVLTSDVTMMSSASFSRGLNSHSSLTTMDSSSLIPIGANIFMTLFMLPDNKHSLIILNANSNNIREDDDDGGGGGGDDDDDDADD